MRYLRRALTIHEKVDHGGVGSLRIGLLIAVAYVGAESLGWILGLSPGYATPLRPAAGVALAALLIAGGRRWPGVWLGAFAFNLWLDTSASGAAFAALTAAGCTLQAFVGARLTRLFFVRQPPLARERDIWRFLVLGGPLACALSASAGVGAMLALGRLPVADAPARWLAWWSGDTLGVLLLAPLVLAAWPSGPLHTRGGRRLWLPLVIACGLLVSAGYLLRRFEKERAHVAAIAAMQEVYDTRFPTLPKFIGAMEGIERLFAVSDDVSREEFAAFTRYIVRQPGVLAVEWAPRVPGDGREAFEATLRAAWGDFDEVTEISAEGRVSPAGTRSVYFPVLFAEPPTGAVSLPGVDLGSEGLRREAMDRARDTGLGAAAGPVSLIQTGRLGVPVFLSVSRSGFTAEGATVEQRRDALRGFVGGVFDVSEALADLSADAARRGLEFRVIDLTDGAPGQILAGALHRDTAPPWQTDVEFAGRSWRVEMQTVSPLRPGDASPLALALGVVSAVVAFLVAFATLGAAGRTDVIRAEVAARTADLERELRARHAAEQDLDVTLRSIGDAVLTTDSEGRITRLNPIAEGLTGWSEGEAVGRPVDDVFRIIHEETREPAVVPVQDVLRTGRTQGLANHTAVIARDGSERAIADSAAPIRGPDGRTRGVVLVFRDVGEEHASKRALQASREELRLLNTSLERIVQERTRALSSSERFNRELFEFAPDAILMIAANGTVVRVNRQAEALFGWPRAEVKGRSVEILMPRARLGPSAGPWPDASPSSPLGAWPGREGLLGLRRDGSTFPIEISVAPMDTDRGPVVVAAVRDVTERVRAETALLESRQRHNDTLDTMREGTQIIGFDWRYLYANDAVARQGGVPKEELLGRTMMEAFPGIEDLPWFARLRRCMVDRVADRWNNEFTRPDGARGGFDLRVQPVREGIFVLSLDITERMQADERMTEHNRAIDAERGLLAQRVAEATRDLQAANGDLERAKSDAEQASRAKSAFLAAMSHEIRTPMNGVVGMVEVLARGELAPHQTNIVRTICDSAFSLLRVVDDILDFSKIEAGRLELERAPVSVLEVVEAVSASLVPLAESKGVDLYLFVGPSVPVAIWTDVTRLRQILNNLIGNAIKFSGSGAERGRVAVRVEVREDKPARLVLQVSDNGIGMSPAMQAQLFEPFFQGELSTTRRFGGTGLGLVICKRIVEVMQGEITVKSAPGAGSVFTVSLPIESAVGQGAEPFPELPNLDCILLEDSEISVDDLQIYLESAGARVHRASGQDDAARQAATLPRAVVIHDVGRVRPSADELHAVFPASLDTGHLLIARGSRVPLQVEAGVVTVDGNALRRGPFLRAVAVAAGRASPEVVQEAGDWRLDEGAASPDIAVARAEGRLILVAEDDLVNQKVILYQLALLGHTAELAGDGAEALRLWREGSYGLLFTDLHMPEMDGYELATAIRREEGGAPPMPILALTANALRGEETRALAIGMQAYLTKPVRLEALRAVLDRWLPSASGPGASPPERADVVAPTVRHPVDVDVLRALVGGDEATVRDLLSEYLVAARLSDAELQLGLAADDVRSVASTAHKLKSASRSVGAIPLADACVALENACASRHNAGIQRWVALIRVLLAEVGKAITSFLNTP
ncbi:MAG: PAS domain S-box protein [Pseudomonadota bacterium]|nr:PAS domain S-box protein [Pseudomonadota bacterium]